MTILQLRMITAPEMCIRDRWYPMQEAEQVSAVYNSWELDDYIQRENLGSELNVKVKYTSPPKYRLPHIAAAWAHWDCRAI